MDIYGETCFFPFNGAVTGSTNADQPNLDKMVPFIFESPFCMACGSMLAIYLYIIKKIGSLDT